jgi:hypothetical protein
MTQFAQWVGYFVMGIGAVAVAAGLLFVVTLLVWEQLKRARGIKRIWDAVLSADERQQEIADARRYRWLRTEGYWAGSNSPLPWVVTGTKHDDAVPLLPGEMDAAIDAAIEKTKP